MSVRYVRPSTKSFSSDFNEIWYVDIEVDDRCTTVCRIESIQSQGHGASEGPKIALFQVYLLRHLQINGAGK